LDISADGEAKSSALGGQQRHSLGDRLPGFAVSVFGQRANFVEFQELQGMLDTDRRKYSARGLTWADPLPVAC